MKHHYPVVTLCGSSKFKDEFIKASEVLSLRGYLVISLGLFGHADKKYDSVITEDIKIMLDEVHKQKIDMSDFIYIINKDDYIGKSTANEIAYAKSLGKDVVYMFPHAE